MEDPEEYLADYSVHKDIFGPYGGKFGPIMFSTNLQILSTTLVCLLGTAICGYGMLQLVLQSGSDPLLWAISVVFVLAGLSIVHVSVIRVYSSGAEQALASLLEEIDEKQ